MANKKKKPASMKVAKAKPQPKQTKEELLKDFKEVMKITVENTIQGYTEHTKYATILQDAYVFFGPNTSIQDHDQVVKDTMKHIISLLEDIKKRIEDLTVKKAQTTTDLIYSVCGTYDENKSITDIFKGYMAEKAIMKINDSYFQLLNELYMAKDE